MTDPFAPEADDADPLMSIGMFSRASLVSIKALRSYHEQGLLIPDSVDPATGYRSYRVSQLTDAVVIKRLRDLDVPLKNVAEVVAARDPEITRKVMAEHEATMRRKLDEVTSIVDQLQQSIEMPSLQTPVHLRREPDTHVLMARGVVDGCNYSSFLDDAYARLFAAVQATGAVMAGPSSACYPAQVQGGTEPVEAYIPIRSPVVLDRAVLDTGVTVELIPAATCAVMTHLGGYASIGDTYRRLGAWVARNARSADQSIRECYVVSIDPGTGALLPDEQLRTEIVWPVVAETDR